VSAEPAAPAPPADPGAIACPRCGRPVGGEQSWCLRCGAAARTRLVPTPGWRAPIVLALVVAALGAAGLAYGFVALTADEDDPKDDAAPVTQTAPAPGPAPTPPAP
jgi:hypothetical protein